MAKREPEAIMAIELGECSLSVHSSYYNYFMLLVSSACMLTCCMVIAGCKLCTYQCVAPPSPYGRTCRGLIRGFDVRFPSRGGEIDSQIPNAGPFQMRGYFEHHYPDRYPNFYFGTRASVANHRYISSLCNLYM